MKEGLPLFFEKSENSDLYLALLHIFSVLLLLFLRSLPSSLITAFGVALSEMETVLSKSPPLMHIFRELTVHHNDWSDYSGRTNGRGVQYYNFSMPNNLSRLMTFLHQPLTVYSQSCPFGFISII